MTSYSGLFNGVYGEDHALIGTRNVETNLARQFRRRGASALREIMQALNGAVAGSNATAQYKRAKAERSLDENVQGGQREIETVTLVNRNTTSGDETSIDNIFDQTSVPSSYPVDKAGVGGGGKLGY